MGDIYVEYNYSIICISYKGKKELNVHLLV